VKFWVETVETVSGTISKLFRGSIFLHCLRFFYPQDSQKELSAKPQQQINNAFIRLNTQAGPSPHIRNCQDIARPPLTFPQKFGKAKGYFEPR